MTKFPFAFWAMVLLAAGLNASAQILIKLSAVEHFEDLKSWLNPALWFAVMLYGISFGLTAIVYHRLPLTVISPLMTGLVFIGVAVYSVLFLAETLSITHLVGIGFILVGVFLLGAQS